MSVRQVFLILWRRSWVVALTFLSTMIVAGGVLYFIPGRYDGIATATIDTGSIDPLTDTMFGGSSTAIGIMQGNMIQLVQSERVALDVVKRLNLTASPRAQADYRESPSFGRKSIDEWMAESIVRNVDPKFSIGSNVLSIRYKTGDPNQAALIANAFLASTIDASIAMKAASGDQTARWFDPQIDELHKEVEQARSALEAFQVKSNVAAPSLGGDSETSDLMTATQTLSGAKTNLAMLQNRLASNGTDLSIDPLDPDLQGLAGLKEKLSTAEAAVASAKNALGPNNPKMLAEAANIAALRKQIADATDRIHQHLKDRIAQTQSLIPTLEAARTKAQTTLIAAQGQRDRLGELERDLAFRIDQLNTRQKMAAQARLQSKLTFANVAVLDKAAPPIDPSFPKPLIVIPVGIAAGLALGLMLALIAEAMDRRIRVPADLEFAVHRPLPRRYPSAVASHVLGKPAEVVARELKLNPPALCFLLRSK